jgi:4-carboxymuconolactone decarboxylase
MKLARPRQKTTNPVEISPGATVPPIQERRLVNETADPGQRRARGLATYRAVYGDDAPLPEGGAAEFFDLLIIDQQFAEVWSRPALPIAARRLLTMGVLAATQRFDILEFQFGRTLATGELTAEQVREVVMHLITYVGTPASGDLHHAAETAIAAHASTTGPT